MSDDLPSKITIGDTEYAVKDMNENALSQLRGIHFCDREIQQLNNEWAIADTARLGYRRALQREMLAPKSEAQHG